MRKIIFPLLLGCLGCAVLISLGVWQMQRLAWKTAILDAIDARITAVPVAIPAEPDAEEDKYLPVTVQGVLTGDPVFALVTPDGLGPGYRYIQGFKTQTRTILVDLGWVPLDALGKQDSRMASLSITGNLHWPDEQDNWTPDPDPSGIWFARDVPRLSAALNTAPVLVVARDYQVADQAQPLQNLPTRPLPLDSSVIKNDHLNYAITWFSLALVWLIMTAFLIFRIRQKDA